MGKKSITCLSDVDIPMERPILFITDLSCGPMVQSHLCVQSVHIDLNERTIHCVTPERTTNKTSHLLAWNVQRHFSVKIITRDTMKQSTLEIIVLSVLFQIVS